MTQLIESFKDTFLKKSQAEESQQTDRYVLEDEFASSANNNSWTVRVVIIVALMVSLVTAVSSFFLVREQERDIKIDIVEFKDVELKKLVDNSLDQKTDLGRLESELVALERAQRSAVNKAKAEIQRKLSEANSVFANKQKIDEIKEQGRLAVNQLDSGFQTKKSKLEQEIKRISQSIDLSSQKVAGLSNGDAGVHSSVEQLNELRINKLTNYYENRLTELNKKHEQELEQLTLRYNPPLAQNSVGKLLAKPVKVLKPVELSKPRRRYLLAQAPEVERTLLNQQRWNNNAEEILRAVRDIPFSHLPQLSAIHLQDTTRKQQSEFNQLAILFGNSMKARELEQKKYIDLVSQLLRQLSLSQSIEGQIGQPLNDQSWSLIFSDTLDPDAILMAAVLNENDGFKGLIEVTQEKEAFVGKKRALNTGFNIEPGDNIVIILKQDAKG